MGEEVPMPWEESSVMDERVSFIMVWREDEESVTELCRQHGISRKTGYKWIGRYQLLGWEGLKDASRAPHGHPNAVSEATVRQVLTVREQHPTWGPKKIRAWLERKHPGASWPAESTIGELLDRAGLVKHRRRRQRVAASASTLPPIGGINDVWGVDFKGWFRTGDGQRCDPLSLSDLASRYVLRLQAVAGIGGEQIWPWLDAAFREFGLPSRMRSDNGPPFGSTAPGGLSSLAVKLIKAGVKPEYIARGKPQQNGRHERLHRTLKAETASPPAATIRQQQRRFDAFCRLFNDERPHEALGQTPPASHYTASTRRYSGRLREPEYPSAWLVRRVRRKGDIKWRGEYLYLSEALAGEPIALEPIDDEGWLIHYGPIALGTLDQRSKFARLRAGTRPRPEPQPQPPG
jgi:transposase InsO family protein